MSDGNVCKQDEYRTLREELLQARKYVFERPLLIIAIGIGGLKVLEGPYVATLPPIVAGLLVFNFGFTATRLMSAARIVAYIQLELEEGKHGVWIGWESCLRWYRKWMKSDPDNKRAEIDDERDKEAIPDALMYYSPLYQLHIVLIALTVISSIVILVVSESLISVGSFLNLACFGLTLLFAGKCYRYTREFHPDIMKGLIERERVIWHYALEYMGREGKKQ